ncbi:terminase [Bradyrhizobium sp. CW4]|uniref:terminase n=1 Tax=Bradyrhizobium sp. CW4 TaxID=2782687 RepID=UPI001FFC15B4|nr:terminase [Bradyrhizobium sp. CW4]MCK1417644.1 terminase [Bradyrhizobium sp. CW4]
MKTALPIDATLCDPQLLGAALGDSRSWSTWLTTLRAAFGLPLSDAQRETFSLIAGGRAPPIQRVSEFWAVIGRRSGKSRVAAAIADHVALLQQHHLAPGEVGHVLVLSPTTTAQAKVVFQYCLGFIERSPVLRQEIASTTASEIRLKNGIVIGTHPNSFRSIRGRTLIACIFDESSFWRDETSALPDVECYRAVVPALATSRGMLIGISSPYRKIGMLYQKHKDCYGVDNPDVLVVQGDSRTFNPTLDEGLIAKATADDPEAALAEWAGQFRSDVAAFLSDADIDACIDLDRPIELPPRSGITYHAFSDPSGGRHDHFTIGVGHREGERTVIDALRGQSPPFDPKLIVGEYAALVKEFGIHEVTGDNYAAAWVEAEFKAAGIRYVRSELPKGRLYIEGLPAFMRRTVALPNHSRLLRELRLLERRAHLGGRESVDHGRVGSDDYANAVFGVLHYARKRKQRTFHGTYGYGGPITWRDPATGEVIDPETGEPIQRVRVVVKRV